MGFVAMADLRDFFKLANELEDVVRACSKARTRILRADATFREFMAYERLAERQQILAHKVLCIHRVATGEAFQ